MQLSNSSIGTRDFTLECWVVYDDAVDYILMATMVICTSNGYSWGAQSNGNGKLIVIYQWIAVVVRVSNDCKAKSGITSCYKEVDSIIVLSDVQWCHF